MEHAVQLPVHRRSPASQPDGRRRTSQTGQNAAQITSPDGRPGPACCHRRPSVEQTENRLARRHRAPPRSAPGHVPPACRFPTAAASTTTSGGHGTTPTTRTDRTSTSRHYARHQIGEQTRSHRTRCASNPGYFTVRRVAFCYTVLTHDVVSAINCPLTIHQHCPGTTACRRARHVGASVTAGSEVPMLGKSAAASCGIGSGLDVVAAHHGSGGRGSGCPFSYSGEGGGCGETPCEVHL